MALPFCGFSRSKYGTYPEYHTSADNLDLVTEAGLFGSFEVFTSIIDAFESGLYPRSSVICEPQLGKRGLYPSISRKDAYNDILKMRMNLLAYADGGKSIFEIANKIDTNLSALIAETEILKKENLIEISNQREK